jgi:hypothetical protein
MYVLPRNALRLYEPLCVLRSELNLYAWAGLATPTDLKTYFLHPGLGFEAWALVKLASTRTYIVCILGLVLRPGLVLLTPLA